MGDNPLQKHFVILCQQLDIEKILPYLNAERMVTPDEYETLTSTNFNTKQKREKLLLLLPRKGRQYFQNFGKCLVWSGQTDLARHIGIDVLGVPESPYPAPPAGGPQLSKSQLQAAYSVFTSMIQDMSYGGHQNQLPRDPQESSGPQQMNLHMPDHQQQQAHAPAHSSNPPSYHTHPPQHPPTCNATVATGPYYPPPNNPMAPTQYPGPPNVTTAIGQYPGPPNVTTATGHYPRPPNATTAVGPYNPLPAYNTNMAQGPYNFAPTNVVAHGQPNVTRATVPHGYHPQPNATMATGSHGHQPQPNVPMVTGPYPHPQPDPYQQYPTSRVPQAQNVHIQPPRRAGEPKVFILYCKDTELMALCNKSADDFCDQVLALADILRYSGVETFIDQYEDHMANWDGWTQGVIAQSDHVLMVCSPQLSQSLQSQANIVVEMGKGKFFNHSVVNSISAPKFVPIFLHDCVAHDWIPASLRMTSNFKLNISELTPLIDVEDETPNHGELVQAKLRNALQDPRFIDIVNLVKLLRQDSDNTPPPVLNPFSLPSGHAPPIRGTIPPSYTHVPIRPIPLPRSDTDPSRRGEPEYISKEDLTRIAEVVPRDWQHLGIKLGVEYTKLEALRTKHPFDSTLATLEMFRLWQTKKGKLATRKALKQALIDLKFGLVAREIFAND